MDYFQLSDTNSRSVGENWNYIHANLLQAVDICIPMKHISNQKKFPWMTPCLKRLIRKKQRFYIKAKWTKTASDWSQFKNIQQQVRQSIRLQCNKYLNKILNSTSEFKGSKPFWNFVKSQNCDHTEISVLQTPDGIATMPTSKAEILNNTFQ